MKETKFKFTAEATPDGSLTVDTNGLQQLTRAGRPTAIRIGTAAGARVQIGRRVLWNVQKVQQYLDAISE